MTLTIARLKAMTDKASHCEDPVCDSCVNFTCWSIDAIPLLVAEIEALRGALAGIGEYGIENNWQSMTAFQALTASKERLP